MRTGVFGLLLFAAVLMGCQRGVDTGPSSSQATTEAVSQVMMEEFSGPPSADGLAKWASAPGTVARLQEAIDARAKALGVESQTVTEVRPDGQGGVMIGFTSRNGSQGFLTIPAGVGQKQMGGAGR